MEALTSSTFSLAKRAQPNMTDSLKDNLKANIGLYTNQAQELYVGTVDEPLEPGENEVLLHIRATGICGTDVNYWRHGHVGANTVTGPLILGHESCADVLKVGPGVTRLRTGDRVALEPTTVCMHCDRCAKGHTNGCLNMKFRSTPPLGGLMRRYIVVPAEQCFKINGLSAVEGALLEPICVGYGAVKRSGLQLGDAILISGAGPLGIVCATVAHANGAGVVTLTDLSPTRLEIAKSLVPRARTVLVRPEETVAEVVSHIAAANGGQKFSACIETTGKESAINAAIRSLDFRGVIVGAALGDDDARLPTVHMAMNEIEFRGLHRYVNAWPDVWRLVHEKLIDLHGLVTRVFPLEKAVEAFEAFTSTDNCVKVVVTD